ncbi:MAG TPA: DUF1844 domain-containing protein [bacterium]|nr:DUF1844 domain-containing protein [bacterium]HQG44038.1 DUF1844 domain-containing protein [bacterium]HQI48152.1 DUF1844 domain-containing protein [bacterium]HQJ65695.1 DUF1844 domain-containing protein [bacterium]
MDEQNKHHAALFFNLVMMFQSAAMQQMGKLKNPMTDAIERNMEQARLSIDMLDMLQAKTAGNLGEDEAKFVAHVISELKLNYIDEVNKDKAKAGSEAAGSETGGAADKAGSQSAEDRTASA